MSYKRTNPAEIRNSCLYFCLFAIALAETVTLSDFKATSSLAGKTCKREDMVFSSSNRNAVECSAICSQEPECTGIFHSYTKRSCIGCRVLYSTETSLEDGNEDTKYLYSKLFYSTFFVISFGNYIATINETRVRIISKIR